MEDPSIVRRPLLVALTTLLVAGIATSAFAVIDDSYQVNYNAADRSAAKAVMLRRSDLGVGWRGGPQRVTKSDLAPLTCPGFHPKVSDLVITGAAQAEWSKVPSDYTSFGGVLQSADMVRLDWQRSSVPAATSCLRRTLAKQVGTQGTLASFVRIAFPRVAPYSVAYRGLVQISAQGVTVPLAIYVVALGRGRTELSLLLFGLPNSLTTAYVARLGHTLIARARA